MHGYSNHGTRILILNMSAIFNKYLFTSALVVAGADVSFVLDNSWSHCIDACIYMPCIRSC